MSRHEDVSSVGEGVMSQKCFGVIDRTGKSSFCLFISALLTKGPWFDFRLGHKEL